jgi:hypothetical protein
VQTKLAGRVLYYLLTTGAGLQTLGEEYCDISQVIGSPCVTLNGFCANCCSFHLVHEAH